MYYLIFFGNLGTVYKCGSFPNRTAGFPVDTGFITADSTLQEHRVVPDVLPVFITGL